MRVDDFSELYMMVESDISSNDSKFDSIESLSEQIRLHSSINNRSVSLGCNNHSWRIFIDSESSNLTRTEEFGIQSDFYIGNSIAYDPSEKTVGTVYKTCYIYADGLFIGKVYGPTNNPSQYKSYVHLDHLGSVRIITDPEGAVKFSARYEPYGKLWSTPVITWKSNLKYIQRVCDAKTNLYCLGVRFYDGEIGRFISEDPVLGSLSSPQSMNRYSYCENDPINHLDPNGMRQNWYHMRGEISETQECLDILMIVAGFVPGLDYLSDAYFVGRDLQMGDYGMAALDSAGFALPIISASWMRLGKAVWNLIDSGSDAARHVDDAADLRKAGSAEELEQILRSNKGGKPISVTLTKDITVYRVYGDKLVSKSWTTIDPRTMKGLDYFLQAGLPSKNAGTKMAIGIFEAGSTISIRQSLPAFNRYFGWLPGGMIEVLGSPKIIQSDMLISSYWW